MNPGNELPAERVVFAQFYNLRSAPAHYRQLGRANRGEDAGHTIALQRFAIAPQFFGGQTVLIEVNAAVAVDLDVEVPFGHFKLTVVQCNL